VSSSRTSGAATRARAAGAGAGEAKPKSGEDGRLAVGFAVLRGRTAWWTAFGVIAGVFLIVMMGTVAQWVGVVLIGIGALSGWSLARTFIYPPGTIVVDDDAVSLPRGLCTKKIDSHPIKTVTAAYFLRRSVPWTRAAPVLVIEAAGQAYTYPRDWFVNEAAQRQVIRAILGRIQSEAV
jgi:hypothetical protein